MDKILTRKLFKDIYLKVVSKRISHFKNGGLAGLKNELEQYAPKGEFLAYINKKEANVLKALGGSGKIIKETGIPSFAADDEIDNSNVAVNPNVAAKLLANPDIYPTYSEGERQAMLLAPIASQLLTGTQQPGQSQLGAVASNVGAAIPKVMETSMQMRKLESERLGAIAKLSKTGQGPNAVWDKAITNEDVKEFKGNQSLATNARANIEDYKVMKELYKNEDLVVGTLGETATGAARLAQSLGIDPRGIQNLKAAELIKQISGKIALGDLQSLKGAISDKEGDWIRSMNAGPASTKAGALAILDFKEKIAQRQIDYAKQQADWVKQYGNLQARDKNGNTWADKSYEYLDKNTVLNSDLRNIANQTTRSKTGGTGTTSSGKVYTMDDLQKMIGK
jgi:hypothetical protein